MKRSVTYISAKEWGEQFSPPISLRRVQALFQQGRIPGAIKPKRDIQIPKNAPDPRKPKGRPVLSAETIKRITIN